LNGDASMVLVWSTRAKLIEQDSGGDVTFTWDQGLIAPGAMAVIKGNPGGQGQCDEVHRLGARPGKAARDVQDAGQGPANPAADALLPPEDARFNPVIQRTSPCRCRWIWRGTKRTTAPRWMNI
jgi:putative spermidine/putrescine transport system substrate-binding protein